MENQLRISQQSIEIDDIISELNQNKPNTCHPHDYEHSEPNYTESPKGSRGDDTFAHYDDENACLQRDS